MTDPSEARTFDAVITGLQESYPPEKMEEISTSFCFICLLHLANERGLKIEVGEGDVRDGEVEERKVGDLWGLKVRFVTVGSVVFLLNAVFYVC